VHVTAINVLPDPDQRTVSRARAANVGLRANIGSGLALDADHAPHITVLKRLVRTGRLGRSPHGRRGGVCAHRPGDARTASDHGAAARRPRCAPRPSRRCPGGTRLGVAVADLVVDAWPRVGWPSSACASCLSPRRRSTGSAAT